MKDLTSVVLEDVRKGSIVQFITTLVLVITFTGYEVARTMQPITSTAIMYWEDGITNEEVERSNFHELCDKMSSWPSSLFLEQNLLLDEKCKVLRSRHMVRTRADWKEYQIRALTLLESNRIKAAEIAKRTDEPPNSPNPESKDAPSAMRRGSTSSRDKRADETSRSKD